MANEQEYDLDQLRKEFGDRWEFTALWRSAATGPDYRQTVWTARVINKDPPPTIIQTEIGDLCQPVDNLDGTPQQDLTGQLKGTVPAPAEHRHLLDAAPMV